MVRRAIGGAFQRAGLPTSTGDVSSVEKVERVVGRNPDIITGGFGGPGPLGKVVISEGVRRGPFPRDVKDALRTAMGQGDRGRGAPPVGGPGTTTGRQITPELQDLISGLLDEEQFRARRQRELDDIRSRRQADIDEGRAFIQDFALGRVTEPQAQENERIRALLESRLGGLTSAEGAALKEQALKGIQQQTTGDIRALRGIQGGQGLRGPAAAAQQAAVLRESADREADLEQQLLLENLAIRRQAAQDFQSELARQQQQQLGIQQVNLAQQNLEAEVRNAFPFLFANLGAQEAATATGQLTARDALLGALFPDLFTGGVGGIGGDSGGVLTGNEGLLPPGALPPQPLPNVGQLQIDTTVDPTALPPGFTGVPSVMPNIRTGQANIRTTPN